MVLEEVERMRVKISSIIEEVEALRRDLNDIIRDFGNSESRLIRRANVDLCLADLALASVVEELRTALGSLSQTIKHLKSIFEGEVVD